MKKFNREIFLWVSNEEIQQDSEKNFCECTHFTLRAKIHIHFLSNWMEYDRGDSFPFDFELNGIPSGTKWKGNLFMHVYVDIQSNFPGCVFPRGNTRWSNMQLKMIKYASRDGSQRSGNFAYTRKKFKERSKVKAYRAFRHVDKLIVNKPCY